jgi:hypothetical protein
MNSKNLCITVEGTRSKPEFLFLLGVEIHHKNKVNTRRIKVNVISSFVKSHASKNQFELK